MGTDTSKRRLIAVGGGKGGVGKSLVSANLAVALAREGAKVVVLDADLGAPNLHTMFGIEQPDLTIEDFLEGRVRELEDLAVASGVPGVSLLCGTSQVLGAANPKWQSKQRLIRQLGRLETDCLLIDVGAGVDFNTIDFFNAADIRLIVLTPEITSVQNAYGFLKIALYRRLQRSVAGRKVSRELAESFGGRAFEIGSSMERVSTFLTLVDAEMPELSAPFRMLLREYNIELIGNMLAKEGDRNVIFAVKRMVQKFLDLDAGVAATFRTDRRARDSVNVGRPLALHKGSTGAAEFTALARKVLAIDLEPIRELRGRISELLSTADKTITLGLDDIELVEVVEEAAVVEEVATEVSEHKVAGASVTEALAVEERAGPAVVLAEASAPSVAPGTPMGDRIPTRPDVPSARSSVQIDRDQIEAELFDELSQVKRASDRFLVNHPVEVMLGGNWHIGMLVDINNAGACVAGIRADARWKKGDGALRILPVGRGLKHADESPQVPVHMRSYDQVTGRIVIEFSEPALAGALVDYFRGHATQR